MINPIKIWCLTATLILLVSCSDQQVSKDTIKKPEAFLLSNVDTLDFKSGIQSIFQDSKGNYWFGSHAEGLSRFDGIDFEYFKINKGLSQNQIRSIQEDKKGNIWFGTSKGVYSYDGNQIVHHPPNLDRNDPNDWLPEIQYIQNKWLKEDGDLWFNAGTQEGVYRYDGQYVSYLPFPKSKTKIKDNVYSLTDLSIGKNKMLWFGTYAGIIGYNGNDFTIINDETLGYTRKNYHIHVRSVLEDSKGRLWIGNNGIGVLLKENDSTINFSKQQGKLLDMIVFNENTRNKEFTKNTGLQSVFVIAEDHNGNIWFGDRDTGAWKYDGESLTNYIIDNKLKSQMIWDIYEDRNKNLLFGMASGGIYQWNGKTFDRRF